LNYRDERRRAASAWSGDEPENFVLMALTAADDPGLLVLPTHRMLAAGVTPRATGAIGKHFRIEDAGAIDDSAARANALARLAATPPSETAFVAAGLEPGRVSIVTLTDRTAIERSMPPNQPAAWRALDVSVLQYGVLLDGYGLDDAAMAAGSAVTYTQDAAAAFDAVAQGRASAAFLLNATPVAQVLAVADAGGLMPQKSTYFHPKLPTGLVMNALD
jgi:uncharacterized protein (DUF1015 family)